MIIKTECREADTFADLLASQKFNAEDWAVARPALSKVARPRRAVPHAVPNWADIDGSWYLAVCGRQSGCSVAIEVFRHIEVRADEADMVSLLVGNWHKQFKREAPSVTSTVFDSDIPRSSALPQQHFAGCSTKNRRLDVYVHGAAHLTTDSPPEIRYSLMIYRHGEATLRFEGIQIGGFSSRHGVMGVSVSPEQHSCS